PRARSQSIEPAALPHLLLKLTYALTNVRRMTVSSGSRQNPSSLIRLGALLDHAKRTTRDLTVWMRGRCIENFYDFSSGRPRAGRKLNTTPLANCNADGPVRNI